MPTNNVVKLNPASLNPEELKDMIPWNEFKCVVVIGIDRDDKTMIGCSEVSANEMSIMTMDLMDYKLTAHNKDI